MRTTDHPTGGGTKGAVGSDDGSEPAELVPTGPTFDACFDQLAQTAYRVAYRILGDREESRDVVQEALARAYVRWNRVRPAAPAWVSRVAANLALDIVRRRARRPAPDLVPDGGDASDRVADRLALARALQDLSKRQREVVVLRYVADLSEADVASLLSCSTGSVKQHAHRGLAALRSALRPEHLADLPSVPNDLEVVP